MDKKVDKYIEKQKSPQKEICKRLRRIILKTFPGIKEEFRMGVPWYGKYYIVALKDKVNMGFCVSGLSEKQMSLFEGKGKYMRHIKIRSLKDIDGGRIVNLLKMVKKSPVSCG
jgi:hypothetical protein